MAQFSNDISFATITRRFSSLYRIKKAPMTLQKNKQALLDQLYKPYQECKACPLGSLGRSTIVFGAGNPEAPLMIIGEAPGKNEDLSGKPFVGRSGALLDKALEHNNINRAETFITNVVKCRPPENRNPTHQEVSTCTKLLLQNQIAIIQPRVICTLGSIATKALIGPISSLKNARGQTFTHQEIAVIPTYHPSFLLRSPSYTPIFIEDFALIAAILQQATSL